MSKKYLSGICALSLILLFQNCAPMESPEVLDQNSNNSSSTPNDSSSATDDTSEPPINETPELEEPVTEAMDNAPEFVGKPVLDVTKNQVSFVAKVMDLEGDEIRVVVGAVLSGSRMPTGPELAQQIDPVIFGKNFGYSESGATLMGTFTAPVGDYDLYVSGWDSEGNSMAVFKFKSFSISFEEEVPKIDPIPDNATVVLNKDFKYTEYSLSGMSHQIIDGFDATWIVANSKSLNPMPGGDQCGSGSLPTNHYPIYLKNMTDSTFRGGRILSDVPQKSDWGSTYCNSAAFFVKTGNNFTLDRVRIEGAWDAIRFSGEMRNFTIQNVWATNFRDDAIENDQVESGVIKDSLFDGGFQGLSIDPGKGKTAEEVDKKLVVLDHVIQRLKPFLFRGEQTHGTFFKGSGFSPPTVLRHNVFAFEVEAFSSVERARSVFLKTKECKNNYFLFLGSDKIPGDYLTAIKALNDRFPNCMKIYSGKEAQDIFTKVKSNWINCHPLIERSNSDPRSDFGKCDPQLIDNGL